MSLLETLIERVPESIRDNAIVRSILDEHEKNRHADRQVSLDALIATQRELPIAIASRDKALAPLLAAEDKAKRELETASRRRVTAQNKADDAVFTIKGRINRHELTLRNSADLRIDQARREVWSRWEHDRHDVGRVEEVKTGRFDDRMRPITQKVSNQAAIRQLLEAMRTADREFEALKLANPTNVVAVISAIAAKVDAAWTALEQWSPLGPDAPRAA